MKRVFKIVLAMIAFAFALSLPAVAAPSVHIRVGGSLSMLGWVRSIARTYMKDHPQVEVSVYRHVPGDDGIKRLIAGELDVAMASRKISAGDSEAAKAKGLKLDEHVVGYGAVVVIVDKQNPVTELSVYQLRKLISGKIANWKEVGGRDQAVAVFNISGKTHPGTSYFLENAILDGAPVVAGAVTLAQFPEIVRKVGETPGAIACVRMRDPFPGEKARTKILKIKKDEHTPSVSPCRATISDGTYAFRRPYYLYTVAAANKEVQGFVDFAATRGWVKPPLTHVW
ncbi:MAG: PstS family phosphate ABC transporter substrate-binding protein [Syntrophobacteraceae bacterium]